jgi:CRP-like cAMP-binding protein
VFTGGGLKLVDKHQLMPGAVRSRNPVDCFNPNQNQLLASLPREEFDLLAQHLELVAMPLGEMVYEANQQLHHAIFPITAVISLHYVTLSGATAEIAGVGHEGVVGVALFMGGSTTSSSAVVQTAGHAYRLDRQQLETAFQRSGVMQSVLLRYMQALMAQVSQTAACNRHHSVDQQLSRWLLLALDRAPGRELVMTQELVANMLGVRRESVTQAAGKLQESGYIRYRRGHITVVDRQGLLTHACECYGMMRKELDRLRTYAQYRHDGANSAR